MTDYTILRKDQTGYFVIESVGVQASSGRRALAVAKVGEGEYVAIPSRSFQPLTVRVEQTTKVTIQ